MHWKTSKQIIQSTKIQFNQQCIHISSVPFVMASNEAEVPPCLVPPPVLPPLKLGQLWLESGDDQRFL